MKNTPGHFIKSTLLLIVLHFFVNHISAQPLKDTTPQILRTQLRGASTDADRIEALQALCRYYIQKPFQKPQDLDSASILNRAAESMAITLKDDKAIGKSYLITATIAQKKKDFKTAETFINKALQLFKSKTLNEQTADAYVAMTDNYPDTGLSVNTKIELFKQALVYFRKSGVKLKIAETLKTISDGYASISDYKTGISYLEESARLYSSIGYEKLNHIYALLGLYYDRAGDLAKGFKYELSAIDKIERTHDSSAMAAEIYNIASIVYYDAQKYDTTYVYCHKALALAIRNKDTATIKDIYFCLIMVLPIMGRLEEQLQMIQELSTRYTFTGVDDKITLEYLFAFTLMKLHRNSEAEPHVKRMLALYNENGGNANSVAYVLPTAIQYYFHTQQYDLARKYLKQREDWLNQSHIIIEQADNELWAFQIDSAQGLYPSAIRHYQTYKVLMDSVTSKEKLQQFNELQVRYNSEKKDRNIQLLTEKGLQQEARLQREKWVRNSIFTGLIMVLLIAALFYNRYRLKQRTNNLLQKKQEEINDQNALLRKLLGEKEWLLREIHHRVKNNLQIVISLLNTQSAYLDNEDALVAIRNSQHRMHAMSLIHQKLYQSENLASIDMQWYVHELIAYMRECFDTDRRMEFLLDLDKLELDVAQAVPLGLILNEAISNAIKYAFPDKQRGSVHISLKNIDSNKWTLKISDNGVGLPQNFDHENSESLGMSLMAGLTDQIDGHFHVDATNGLSIQIDFKVHHEMTETENEPNNMNQTNL